MILWVYDMGSMHFGNKARHNWNSKCWKHPSQKLQEFRNPHLWLARSKQGMNQPSGVIFSKRFWCLHAECCSVPTCTGKAIGSVTIMKVRRPSHCMMELVRKETRAANSSLFSSRSTFRIPPLVLYLTFLFLPFWWVLIIAILSFIVGDLYLSQLFNDVDNFLSWVSMCFYCNGNFIIINNSSPPCQYFCRWRWWETRILAETQGFIESHAEKSQRLSIMAQLACSTVRKLHRQAFNTSPLDAFLGCLVVLVSWLSVGIFNDV